jgi:hypothetical protein
MNILVQLFLISRFGCQAFVSCDSLLVGCIVVHCARSKIALDSFVPRKAAITSKELQKAAAALAITFMLLFVARLATSYDRHLATSVHLDLDSQDESIENPNAIFHGPNPPPPAAGQVTSTNKTTAHSSNKIAVILKSRPLPHLLPLLLHFSTVLGTDWPIHVFTSPTTKSKLLKALFLKRPISPFMNPSFAPSS